MVFFITCAIVAVYGIIQIPQGIRVSAPFEGQSGEPNTFGGYLLFIFCLALGLLLKKVPKNTKYYLAGLIILISFPFLYTLSRASYIAIIFSFLTFILFSKRKIVLITVMVAIAVSIILIKPEAVFFRVKYTFLFDPEIKNHFLLTNHSNYCLTTHYFLDYLEVMSMNNPNHKIIERD